MKEKKLKIAVTGGIGSGKSTVMEMLKNAGYNTISCDVIAKNLFDDKEVKLALSRIFPDAVRSINLPVDRKKISDQVFADKEKLKELNQLTHPLIVKKALEEADNFGGISFIEVPLLFEGEFVSLFDSVIVVKRDKKARVESVIKRSNLTESEVLARINNQVDYDNIDLLAVCVIDNNGNEKDLEKHLFENIKKII